MRIPHPLLLIQVFWLMVELTADLMEILLYLFPMQVLFVIMVVPGSTFSTNIPLFRAFLIQQLLIRKYFVVDVMEIPHVSEFVIFHPSIIYGLLLVPLPSFATAASASLFEIVIGS
jgi:hypothetical protein